MKTLFNSAAVSLSAAILAACGSNETIAADSLNGQSVRTKTVTGNLYVANYASNKVTIYAPGSSKILRTLSQGLYEPKALAFDRHKNLYVIVQSNVIVYAPGRTSVLRTIHVGGKPITLLFDTQDELLVAEPFRVQVLRPNGTVLRTITRGVSHPSGIAFDSTGNLYVANSNSSVSVYAAGGVKLLRTIWQGLFRPNALAFDASGNLYVANLLGGSGNGVVAVYAPGSTSALRTITQGVNYPVALALDSANNLYVANDFLSAGTVTVYAPGQGTVSRTIDDGVLGPLALAFDSSGILYVANYVNNTVTEYARGTTTPQLTISKGIRSPLAIAIGP